MFEGDLETQLASAIKARNRLIHGFYERHDFRIQSEEGRDLMIADLELLHDELLRAWKIAGAMTTLVLDNMLRECSQNSEDV